MGDGIWVAVLTFLALVAVAVVETMAYVNVGGWLDVRASRTADEVRADIEEYGPEVPGLRLNLLPPDERQAILEARQASAEARAANRSARN